MRYPASEKHEIIRLVEESHLPVTRTLKMLGVPRSTFYRWYDRFLIDGVEGLEDRSSAPSRVWNRIEDDVRDKIVELALKETELSPRELAVTFTDKENYFVSEASVYRHLKAHDLITSPAFIVMKADNEFRDKTTRPNEMLLSAIQTLVGQRRRWHQTLKNRILLENYFFPTDLENEIAAFIDHYNHHRYHESLGNLKPADVYFGKGQAILEQRQRIKHKTIKRRRLQHQSQAFKSQTLMS